MQAAPDEVEALESIHRADLPIRFVRTKIDVPTIINRRRLPLKRAKAARRIPLVRLSRLTGVRLECPPYERLC